jgi:hypothetical protein
MKKQISAALAVGLIATMIPGQSFANILPPPPPPPIHGGGGGGGAGGAGGIIGVAAFFVVYDLIRRTTCSGDFLHMGGPGFSTRIRAGDSILPPNKCYPLHKKRHALHAKG